VYQAQPDPASGKRRRGRTIVLVLVMAALVGGGGAAAMRYADNWRQDNDSSATTGGNKGGTGTGTGDKPTADATNSSSAAPGGALPQGWVRVKDPDGFSLALPGKDWKREVHGSQIDYTPDGGQHFVRVAVDDSPDFEDPYRHQLDLEQQVKKLKDYQRMGLQENTFRDCPGSLWDFTWTALPAQGDFPGPRRAIEESYLARNGVEYAIYMSSPSEDWVVTRQQFGAVLRNWREAG
jgi:hypothetical protein